MRRSLLVIKAFKLTLIISTLGICLGEQGRLDEAIVAFRKTIQIDPNDAGTYCNLGLVLYAQGKLDESIASCCKAIQLDPNNSAFQENLEIAQTKQNK